MVCYGNIRVSFLHCVRNHLFQGMDAVAFIGMHMEVAFYILNLYKLWQLTFFSSLNLAHILSQFRRYERQTNCLVDIFFSLACQPFITFFIKDSIFAYLEPHLLCPVTNCDIVRLRTGKILKRSAE